MGPVSSCMNINQKTNHDFSNRNGMKVKKANDNPRSEKYKSTNEQSSFQNSMDNSNTKSLHSNRDIDNKFDNVLISPSKANARLLKKTKSK